MALTRFYYDWNFRGEEVLLPSRAMDEVRYVQPQIAELHKSRGVNSIYHNNAIQTWLVNKNGEIENVGLGEAGG
jgi:sulfane dehydrogenase subunit SoxC